MYKRVFIDANVLIDTNDTRRTSSEESLKIIYFLIENRVSIYTSCDLITTIYYILAKADKENALESIEQIITFTKIIDFSNKEVEETCKLMREDTNYKDLEDTLQYVLAKKENCELILSNDKGFYSLDIEVMSSKAFFDKLAL
jgi:predicted nucleic acid-binding protein